MADDVRLHGWVQQLDVASRCRSAPRHARCEWQFCAFRCHLDEASRAPLIFVQTPGPRLERRGFPVPKDRYFNLGAESTSMTSKTTDASFEADVLRAPG